MIEIQGSDPFARIPINIDSQFATGLSPFRPHHGLGTRLYNIEGYPELLDRVYVKGEEHLPETIDGLTAMYKAHIIGSFLLPSRLFLADDAQHVVTTKVNGKPLTEMIAEGSVSEVLDRTDLLYASLGGSIVEAARQGGMVADDIMSPGQYMYGTTLGSSRSQLYLVDLPDGARSLAPDSKVNERYNRCVMDWVNGITETESRAGEQLLLARHVASREVFALSQQMPRGQEWVAAFRGALDSQMPLDTDEPPISSLVTY